MKLLDRYLDAVRQSMFVTSRATRNDILRELEEELRAEFDAKEGELGRSLTDSEADQILQRFGHPLVVAGRYSEGTGTLSIGPQLIGPELFPLYRMVLAISLSLTAITLATISLTTKVIGSFSDFLPHLLLQAAIVTAIFIAAQAWVKGSIRRGWSMLTTAETPDRNRIPRSSSIAEMIFTILFATVWMELPSYENAIRLVDGETWSAGAVWSHFHSTFFLPVLIVMAISIALAFVNLIDPYRRPMRLWFSAITNLAFAGMVAFTLSRHWSLLVSQTNALRFFRETMSKMEKVDYSTNVTVAWILGVFALAALGQAIYEIVRATQLQSSRRQPADHTVHTAAL